MYHHSVSWHIIPMKFSIRNIIRFGQKESIKVQFLRLLSALMSVNPIPHYIFETTRSGFIQILHHSSASRKITTVNFCSWNLLHFGQKESIETKYSDFWEVRSKFNKFLVSYFKPQVRFFYITLHCHEW